MKLHRESPWWRRALRRLGRRLVRVAENNDDPRPERNGERWLLRQLLAAHAARTAAPPFVVFDAGANEGAYTRLVLEQARRRGCAVMVHAFEPSAHNLGVLSSAFAGEPAVRLIGAALADHAGEAALYAGGSGSSQASLMPRAGLGAGPADAVRVSLLRLDDYLLTRQVAHVDLLKLDVEGSELAALRGLGERLRPEVVDVIQFEYGGTTLDAGTSLRELYRLLAGRGYAVAKLFPRWIEVRDYHAWMENYAYANYAALAPHWLEERGAGRDIR